MKKKILKVILNLLMIGVIFSGLTFGVIWSMNEKITLNQEVVLVEYGENYNPTIEDLINLEKFHYIDVKNVQLESNIYNEKDKDYPGVGEYKIYIYYKNKTLEQRVQVKDTIAPEVINNNIIEIQRNTDLSTVDFLKYIEVNDLSPLKEYKVELVEIDSSSIGEYETIIIIEDIYGNKTEENIIIKVLENIEENAEVKIEEKTVEVEEKKTSTTNKISTKLENINNTEKPKNNSNKNTNTNISTNTQSESKNNTINSDNNQNKENTSNSTKVENKEDVVENLENSDNTNDKKKEEEIKQEEPKETPKCTHSNENYYNSESEAIAVYKTKTKELGNKVKNGEITYEEYIKLCPYGYETMSCPYCGKWTISFYYK